MTNSIATRVPEAVADMADRLGESLTEAGCEEGLNVLVRLRYDSRMETVWRTLYMKDQDATNNETEGYKFPARISLQSRAEIKRKLAQELIRDGGEANKTKAALLELVAKAYDKAEENGRRVFPKSRWTEQDKAARLILDRACRLAITNDVTFQSDVDIQERDRTTMR